MGRSFPEIAIELRDRGLLGHAAVHRAIAEWVAVPLGTVVAQECFKLARLEQRWWPLAIEGDIVALTAVNEGDGEESETPRT